MTIAPNLDAAIDYLERWKPGGPWPLCAFHEDRTNSFHVFRDGEIDSLREWITDQQVARRNIYYHVNTVALPKNGKAQKDHVQSVDWLHVDLDPERTKPLESERARILATLENPGGGLPKPTIIVFSGGGYQAFWKLDTPIEIGGNVAACEDAEAYSSQIAIMLGGDRCHNADRIMRLPGTINWPNAKKRESGQVPALATVVHANWELSYPLSSFVAAPKVDAGPASGSPNQVEVKISGNISKVSLDDPALAKISDRTKAIIIHGLDPDQPLKGGNSRSDWTWHVACDLHRTDIDDDTIYAILTDPEYGISEHIRAQGNQRAQHRAAVRTIQRAKEHAIDPWLEIMNNEYAVIESVGGKFRIVCERYSHAKERYEIEFHLPDGFMRMYSNKFIKMPKHDKEGNVVGEIAVPVGKWWLAHEKRREYREVTFFPNHEVPNAMNLWRGFSCDARPGDCSLFLEHIRKVLCKGNDTYYNYLIGWMANSVQRPHLPGQVAIVMRGGQGTGKGTFGKLFGKLFGSHYKYVSNPKHITGQFNFLLHDAVLVFADECFAANDKAAESALKSLITEPTIRVEPKNIDNLEARNCVHLIMATNHEWAISADMDDRRFFVIEVDDKHRTDVGYFAKIHEQMDSGGYEALLHYLTTYDLSRFDVYNCPKTVELRKQQEHSMNELSSFWLHTLEEGRLLPSHSNWRSTCIKEALTERFRAEYPKFGLNANRALGIFLSKFGVRSAEGTPEVWIDSRGMKRDTMGRPKIWRFPDLKESRMLWETVTNSGPRDWPEVIDIPDAEAF